MIKITFISNILDQSMIGFCDSLSEKQDIVFHFITIPVTYSAVKTRVSEVRSYAKLYTENKNECDEIIENSDVLIIGHASDLFIKKYGSKKLIIKSSERIFKDKKGIKQKIHNFLSVIKHHSIYQIYKPLYFGIGKYGLNDMRSTHIYGNRAYKWAYYPKIDDVDIKNCVSKYENVKSIQIVWAGRMVDCKCIEDIILSANYCCSLNIDFKIKLIGDGPNREKLVKLVDSLNLKNKIEFCGLKPLNETLSIINSSHFLFMASDEREGWGVVVNNAMNYGTVIIANCNGGAASTMLTQHNSFTYSKSSDAPNTLMSAILSKEDILKEKALNAYNDLVNLWSPAIAADRFIEIVKNALVGKYKSPYDCGSFSQK